MTYFYKWGLSIPLLGVRDSYVKITPNDDRFPHSGFKFLIFAFPLDR
ncbi:MAG: hypothetical protein V6Z82_00925 [Flavobacteriales bacterium]